MKNKPYSLILMSALLFKLTLTARVEDVVEIFQTRYFVHKLAGK